MEIIRKTGSGGGGGTGSVVTSSSTNGRLTIDGSSIIVYDDATIVTALNSKAASVHAHAISDVTGLSTVLTSKAASAHTHVSSDITDFDTANKTDGYAMIYEAATSKVKLKPLPAGNGSGATSMAGLSDVDVTTIAPVESNVMTFTGGKWKPAGAPVGNSACGASCPAWRLRTRRSGASSRRAFCRRPGGDVPAVLRNEALEVGSARFFARGSRRLPLPAARL